MEVWRLFGPKALIRLNDQPLSLDAVSGCEKEGALIFSKCRLLVNISLRKAEVMGHAALGKLSEMAITA